MADPTATLLVRATTTIDVTGKGRVLLGQAQFTTLPAADQEVQQQLETRGRTELQRIGNTFVNGIDAAQTAEGWEIRAEVVAPRPPEPRDVGRVERVLADMAGKPVTLSVLNPDVLIVRREGYTSVQRVVEQAVSRELTRPGKAEAAPPVASKSGDQGNVSR